VDERRGQTRKYKTMTEFDRDKLGAALGNKEKIIESHIIGAPVRRVI